jgi:hypothetical protein
VARSKNLILFEPWHLGDALIAFAIALLDPARLCVACHPRWHEIIGALSDGLEMPKLLGVDLPYINKVKPRPWQLGEFPRNEVNADVVSIRGDVRDYYAARKLFPHSKLSFNGWVAFLARRSKVVDFPFARGWLPIRNRYRAWAAITGLNWDRVEAFYQHSPAVVNNGPIIVHVGAQWRVKQFPFVAELAAALRSDSSVKIVAGARDSLPEGIYESDVVRLVDRDLVDAFRACSCVIANDSGPMHLAALLRRRTIAISRLSSIEEWLPPAVFAVRSGCAPKGYMPDPAYQSEGIIGGWPPTSEVVRSVHASLSSDWVRATHEKNTQNL